MSAAAKRVLDVLVAGLLLLVLLPAMVLVLIAVMLDSPGSPFFRQTRVGRGGRRFKVIKFRTMCRDAEAMTEELRAQSRDPDWLDLERDPRVTRVGRVLRLASLDELPQLVNVLLGDMSMVGPRPLIESEHQRLPAEARRRDAVRPGLTGLWQVSGRTDVSFSEMLELDCRYVDEQNLVTDARLMARTVPAVLMGRGAN